MDMNIRAETYKKFIIFFFYDKCVIYDILIVNKIFPFGKNIKAVFLFFYLEATLFFTLGAPAHHMKIV